MINIKVNFDGTGQTITAAMKPILQAVAQDAIQNTLAAVKDKWQTEAQQKLHSTLPLYLMGLDFDSIVYPYEGNYMTGAIILKGTLPNMLESGFGAFDMKTGFSKSDRIHHTKAGGWYLTIPFRHSTPGSYLYGAPMPQKIYNQVKKLQSGQSISVKGDLRTSWTGYQHKANIYDNMTKIQKQYAKAKQSQYFTFRRVSNKSDPAAFWHPGYIGVKISQSLAPYAEQTLQTEVQAALDNL